MGTAIAILLCLVYGGGCYYIAGKTRGNFQGSGRWIMVALWPLFLAGSPRFRKSLKR